MARTFSSIDEVVEHFKYRLQTRQIDNEARRELERQILAAAQEGQTELADKLTRDLLMANQYSFPLRVRLRDRRRT